MKTKKKALLLALCAVLLVVASVLGTFAYLTDTETVKNTFTVGQVGITLTETGATVDNNSELTNKYHLIPGQTYTKDPTVTVDAKSEDAYVRMIVTVKNVGELEAALSDSFKLTDLNDDEKKDVALEKLLNNTWNFDYWHFEKYTEVDTAATYEFRYYNNATDENYAAYSETANELPALFTTIAVPGELTNDAIAHLAKVEIEVTAHAMQRAGFENNEDGAWSNFNK